MMLQLGHTFWEHGHFNRVVNLSSHFPKSFLPHASSGSFMMMSVDDITPEKSRFSKETRFDYIQQLKRHI